MINMRGELHPSSGGQLMAELHTARVSSGLSQAALAERAGLSRMTIQKTENGTDARYSTLVTMARALGMEIMLVPADLRTQLEEFIHSGGRFLAQPSGVNAPASVVDALTKRESGS
jgi:transcriptional regulator with XRE-family HTH domain